MKMRSLIGPAVAVVFPVCLGAQLTDTFWRGSFDVSFPPPTDTLPWFDGANWSTGAAPATLLLPVQPTYPLGNDPDRVLFDSGFQAVGTVPPYGQGFGGTIQWDAYLGPFTERHLGGVAMVRAVRGDPDGSFTGTVRPDSLIVDLNGNHLFVRPPESTYFGVPAGGGIHVSADGMDADQPIARLTIRDGSIGAHLDVREYGRLTLTHTLLPPTIADATPRGIGGLVDSAGAGEALAILTLDGYQTTGLHLPSNLSSDPSALPPFDVSPAVLRVGEQGYGLLELINSSAIEGLGSSSNPTLQRLHVGGNYTEGISNNGGVAEVVLRNQSRILAEQIYVGELGAEAARLLLQGGSRVETTDVMVIGRSAPGEVYLSSDPDGGLPSFLGVDASLFVGLNGPDDPGGAGLGLLDVRGGEVRASIRTEVGVRGAGKARFGFAAQGDTSTLFGLFETPILTIGNETTGLGVVEFAPGSTGEILTYVEVGKMGNGTLVVGEVTGFGSVYPAQVYVGRSGPPFPPRFNVAVDPGSTGLVIVQESGALFVSDGNASTEDAFLLGRQGIGQLQVLSGGALVTERSFIGETSVSRGEAVVSGKDLFTGLESSWENSGELFVGYAAGGSPGVPGGSLEILDGGLVFTRFLSVGTESGGFGRVIVGGPLAPGGPNTPGYLRATETDPSRFAVVVGRFGLGEVFVTEGVFNADSSVAIGTRPGGRGVVEIGAGGLFQAGGSLNLSVEGGGTGTGFGRGELLLRPGGTAVAESVRLGLDSLVRIEAGASLDSTSGYRQLGGRTELDGGTLIGAIFELLSGELVGSGTLVGPITMGPDFELSPGFSLGTLIFNDSVNLQGLYAAELGAGSMSDLLVVGENLVLGATSILEVTLLGMPQTPPAGTSYTIATYSSSRSGTFGTFNNLTGLPLVLEYGPAEGSGFVRLTVIPEPSTWALVAAVGALGGVCSLRCRKGTECRRLLSS